MHFAIHAARSTRAHHALFAPHAPHGTDTSAPLLQAGARDQPATLLALPIDAGGQERERPLAARFMARGYKGSGKLAGMTALITGADSGIGRAVAVLFAREGADVAVGFHSSAADARVTEQHVQAEGRRCLVLQGDVRDSAWCHAAVQGTVDAFGRLDVLVNTAAFQPHADDPLVATDERLQDTLDTTIGGSLRMAHAALPHMKQGASIINTGNATGLRGPAQLRDHAAGKAGIHALTKALAASLVDRGIRVNGVAPGPVWTLLNTADLAADAMASFGQDTDMHRAAQPEELSPAYVFLASPVCAGYITGIVLAVTGSVGVD